MKKTWKMALTAIITIVLVILNVKFNNQKLDDLQKETMKVLFIVCGVSVLYCFVVGEISRNNSQMDKLWSILPIVYAWIVCGMGGFNLRLVIMAVLVTMWGARLTYNFAKKGAYSIRFWEGEEDYRWVILRESKQFKAKWKWAIFDLLFISLYQNVLVLAICFPMVAVMGAKKFNAFDVIAMLVVLGFIILETIADKQQMAFYNKRKELMKDGKKLSEIEAPYNKGFNTMGLWSRSRHPNYFSEQAIWLSLCLFVITGGVANIVFNWSWVGSILLVLLFLGSSTFQESVSSKKYPEYQNYINKVSKYIPLWKYEK